jgi:hypothetical protein
VQYIFNYCDALKPGWLLLFSLAKKVSKNATAAEKMTKNQYIPLKENNSPR